MTEQEFRARFDADKRAGQLTWVFGDIVTEPGGLNTAAIALGLDGPETILARGIEGMRRIPMADATFAPSDPR